MDDTTDTTTGEDEDLAAEDSTTDALENADDPATEDPRDPTSTEVR